MITFPFSPGKTDSTPLPWDPKDIERLYFIRQQDPYSSVYVEERLHSELSLPRRLRQLHALPPTLRNSIDQELNYVPEDLDAPHEIDGDFADGTSETMQSRPLIVRNEKLAQEYLILAHVKAIYCLPKHKRPRAMIRAILEDFPGDQIHATCEMAKEWRILTSIKKSSYRIPGQKVGGSERLGIMLNGAYPRRFTVAATGADETYAKADSRPFRLDTGPAEMMVFLTDVAMGWLRLSMVQPEESGKEPAFEEPYGQGAILHFDVNLKNTRALSMSEPLPASSKIGAFDRVGGRDEENAELPTSDAEELERSRYEAQADTIDSIDPWRRAIESSKSTLSILLEAFDTSRRQLYESVFTLVAGSCATGMLPQDLKVKRLQTCALQIQ